MYRLATTSDMMADVLRLGHRATVVRYSPILEKTMPQTEYVMPHTGPLRYACGHLWWEFDDDVPAEEVERLTGIALTDLREHLGAQGFWDHIATVLDTRCDRCIEHSIDGVTEGLESSIILPSARGQG